MLCSEPYLTNGNFSSMILGRQPIADQLRETVVGIRTLFVKWRSNLRLLCAGFLISMGRASGRLRAAAPLGGSSNPVVRPTREIRTFCGSFNNDQVEALMSNEQTRASDAPISKQYTHKWVTQIDFDPMDTVAQSIRAIEGFSEIIRYTIAADIIRDICNQQAFEVIADGLESHAKILRQQVVDAKRVQVEKGAV